MLQMQVAKSTVHSKLRWPHMLILLAILAIGAGLRFWGLTRENLWLDEYRTLYFSTARAQEGTSVFDAPLGVVLNPAPATDFVNAPPWWRIWTGMSNTVHPPLHQIVLRWWVDLFGDGDFSTRALSVVFDLAAAVVLFAILLRTQGVWPGIIAAGLLCFSCAHLDLSQETRSYTQLVFLGLLCCLGVVLIEEKGVSAARVVGLGLAVAATALTHYFSAGAMIALGIYALIRLRGDKRWAVLGALAAGILLVAIVWGPFFWAYRAQLGAQEGFLFLNGRSGPAVLFMQFLALPTVLVFRLLTWPYPKVLLSLAILAYLLPLVNLRRTRDSLLWWIWMMGTIGFVLSFDLVKHTRMVAFPRYVILASPAMYALLATPLPMRGWFRWVAPVTILFCALCYGVERAAAGPPYTPGFKYVANCIATMTDPREIIVFTKGTQYEPSNTYLGIRHYLSDWQHPVVFLKDGPPSEETMRLLRSQQRFWVVGQDAATEMPVNLPGQWRMDIFRPTGPVLMLWDVIPDNSPATSSDSTAPSR
jgi:hypothetical protein